MIHFQYFHLFEKLFNQNGENSYKSLFAPTLTTRVIYVYCETIFMQNWPVQCNVGYMLGLSYFSQWILGCESHSVSMARRQGISFTIFNPCGVKGPSRNSFLVRHLPYALLWEAGVIHIIHKFVTCVHIKQGNVLKTSRVCLTCISHRPQPEYSWDSSSTG